MATLHSPAPSQKLKDFGINQVISVPMSTNTANAAMVRASAQMSIKKVEEGLL